MNKSQKIVPESIENPLCEKTQEESKCNQLSRSIDSPQQSNLVNGDKNINRSESKDIAFNLKVPKALQSDPIYGPLLEILSGVITEVEKLANFEIGNFEAISKLYKNQLRILENFDILINNEETTTNTLNKLIDKTAEIRDDFDVHVQNTDDRFENFSASRTSMENRIKLLEEKEKTVEKKKLLD
ncbi:MAG: hypothetical protein LBC44_04030 [Mycoplasmataceae bacterium]|jgi:hypothetical protein|nr:hypothetical protein [Mycoplasmataceae bacterium]